MLMTAGEPRLHLRLALVLQREHPRVALLGENGDLVLHVSRQALGVFNMVRLLHLELLLVARFQLLGAAGLLLGVVNARLQGCLPLRGDCCFRLQPHVFRSQGHQLLFQLRGLRRRGAGVVEVGLETRGRLR